MAGFLEQEKQHSLATYQTVGKQANYRNCPQSAGHKRATFKPICQITHDSPNNRIYYLLLA